MVRGTLRTELIHLPIPTRHHQALAEPIPMASAGLRSVYRRLDRFDPTDAANRYDLRIQLEDATYGRHPNG